MSHIPVSTLLSHFFLPPSWLCYGTSFSVNFSLNFSTNLSKICNPESEIRNWTVKKNPQSAIRDYLASQSAVRNPQLKFWVRAQLFYFPLPFKFTSRSARSFLSDTGYTDTCLMFILQYCLPFIYLFQTEVGKTYGLWKCVDSVATGVDNLSVKQEAVASCSQLNHILGVACLIEPCAIVTDHESLN